MPWQSSSRFSLDTIGKVNILPTAGLARVKETLATRAGHATIFLLRDNDNATT